MERLYRMVEGSNRKFPDGVDPYQMATRLLEECGEVASEINHWENSGTKKQKLADELRQAMAELIKIAMYYHVEKELEASIDKKLQQYQKEGLLK